MFTECAICLVTDENFLLVTLIAVLQMRQYVAAHAADIFIFFTGPMNDRAQQVIRFCEPQGIRLVPLDSRAYSDYDENQLNRADTGIPPVALGRLVIENLLPASCKRIVYLDGDTWIKGDPTPLINAVVPPGRFAAAEDTSSFCRYDITRNGGAVRSYLRGIGVDLRKGYFNTGVMAASRETWRQVMAEAYGFFLKNTFACRYYDQSAINAVADDRRIPLSLAWNFQTHYRMLDVERRIAPRIFHFTNAPKPWMVRLQPWPEMFDRYAEEFRRLAFLNLPHRTVPAEDVKTANARAIRERHKMKYLLPLRWHMRHRNIDTYQAGAFCGM
ncbi:MAG: glycosyltransferase family 8 protein [Bdellovibrionales bacterium]